MLYFLTLFLQFKIKYIYVHMCSQEWNHTTPSSTILRSPILARAVRLIPLEDTINIEECDEMKKQTRSKMGHRYWTSSKPSRLLHPIGSHVFDPFLDII